MKFLMLIIFMTFFETWQDAKKKYENITTENPNRIEKLH